MKVDHEDLLIGIITELEENTKNEISQMLSTLLETYSLDPDLFENDLTNTELQSNNTKMDVTKSGRLLVKICWATTQVEAQLVLNYKLKWPGFESTCDQTFIFPRLYSKNSKLVAFEARGVAAWCNVVKL